MNIIVVTRFEFQRGIARIVHNFINFCTHSKYAHQKNTPWFCFRCLLRLNSQKHTH